MSKFPSTPSQTHAFSLMGSLSTTFRSACITLERRNRTILLSTTTSSEDVQQKYNSK